MEQEKDLLKLRNQLCFPMYLCSKEVIRKYTPLLNEIDLTYTQYIVMMYFWEKETSNLKDLGKILLLDPSTLTPLLKKLENKGYITRDRSTTDERNLEIKITEKGKKLKGKAKFIPNKIEKCIDLSKEEEKTLQSILYKILMKIEKED